MHGRKKATTPVSAEEAAAINTKVATYQKLASKLLAARTAGSEPNPALFELQAQLLKINPDFYTLWNHRKEMLLAQQGAPSSSSSSSSSSVRALPSPLAESVVSAELILTRQCIQRQPKSYGAWHHRLWVAQGCTGGGGGGGGSGAGASDRAAGGTGLVDLGDELELCAQFLQADERNFHCWAYRMQVAAMAGRTAGDELDFTREKVLDNFSNYSAFHYRSKVLERLPRGRGGGGGGGGEGMCFSMDIVREELDMVVDAAFTEPYDQSAWWYHRFLLDWADRRTATPTSPEGSGGGGGVDAGAEEVREEFLDVLRGQVEDLRGLVEMEEQCKWAHLTLAQTIMRLRAAIAQQQQQQQQQGLEDGGDGDDGDSDEAQELGASLGEHFERLAAIDPQRSGFYAAMRRKAGLVAVV